MGVEISYKLANVNEIKSELVKKAEQALTAVGMKGETNAKKEITSAVYDSPSKGNYIRTGYARNSITWALAGKKPNISSWSGKAGSGPKKTGRFTGTAPAEPGGIYNLAVYWGAGAIYAPSIENGSRNMRARPFIAPSFNNYQAEYKATIEKYLKLG